MIHLIDQQSITVVTVCWLLTSTLGFAGGLGHKGILAQPAQDLGTTWPTAPHKMGQFAAELSSLKSSLQRSNAAPTTQAFIMIIRARLYKYVQV